MDTLPILDKNHLLGRTNLNNYVLINNYLKKSFELTIYQYIKLKDMRKTLLILMLMGFCAVGSKTHASRSIENTVWNLRILLGEEIEDGYEASIYFNSETGQLSGKAFCNDYLGGYTISANNQISCSPGITTLKFCFSSMQKQALFIETLREVNNFSIVGSRLLLYKDSELLMEFGTNTFEDTTWYVHHFLGEGIGHDYEASIRFNSETGQLSGKAFCNDYLGVYSLSTDNQISCSVGISTLKFCFSTMQMQSLFIETLAEVDNYLIEDGALLLFNGEEFVIGCLRTPPVAPEEPEEPEIIGISGYKYYYDNAGNRTLREIIYLYGSPSSGYTKGGSGTKKKSYDDYDTTEYEQPIARKTNDFELNIYPNPTKGMLKIDVAGENEIQNALVEIYTVNGKKIYSIKNVQQNYQVDLSSQANGVYIMRIELNNSQYEWKIIKK